MCGMDSNLVWTAYLKIPVPVALANVLRVTQHGVVAKKQQGRGSESYSVTCAEEQAEKSNESGRMHTKNKQL